MPNSFSSKSRSMLTKVCCPFHHFNSLYHLTLISPLCKTETILILGKIKLELKETNSTILHTKHILSLNILVLFNIIFSFIICLTKISSNDLEHIIIHYTAHLSYIPFKNKAYSVSRILI